MYTEESLPPETVSILPSSDTQLRAVEKEKTEDMCIGTSLTQGLTNPLLVGIVRQPVWKSDSCRVSGLTFADHGQALKPVQFVVEKVGILILLAPLFDVTRCCVPGHDIVSRAVAHDDLAHVELSLPFAQDVDEQCIVGVALWDLILQRNPVILIARCFPIA